MTSEHRISASHGLPMLCRGKSTYFRKKYIGNKQPEPSLLVLKLSRSLHKNLHGNLLTSFVTLWALLPFLKQ